MGKDAYLYALADRPFGRVQVLVSANPARELISARTMQDGWYLVHFEAQCSLTIAQATKAEITDVKQWIQAANPAWRDRFGDLLQQVDWP